MRNLLIIISLISLISCTESESTNGKKSNQVWSKQNRVTFLLNRQDSAMWDLELFNEDLEFMDDELTGPFVSGVFPVPRYDLIGKGSFTGVGSFGYFGQKGYYKTVKDKVLLYNSFSVKKNTVNNDYLGSLDNEVFFQIIVLTNYIDTINFRHCSSEMISRNHPDYLGQGYFKTLNNQIDYSAFITAERKSFAIINTRLFDLSYGKTILIAPQKDKSLRSLQIKLPEMSTNEIDTYTDSLLKERNVIDFFTYQGNI